MKRLGIYFFYDNDGVANNHIFYFLKSLKTFCSELCIVVNGNLTEESKNALRQHSDKLLQRDNVGFDVWAYREAIDEYGYKKLKEYDELLLCNFTCYGPIYPFSEMFDEMAKRNCDFWGIAKHPEQPNYLLPNKKGYIYEHIMSYFMIVKANMLHSKDFSAYWNSIPMINTKTESTAYHETVFTKHFEDLGYKSDSFVNLDDYKGRCYNSSILLANELLIKSRCPLVKRRAFFFPPYDNLLDVSSVHQAAELMDFITNKTQYDENLIWDDILETQKISVLKNNMHLNYILPDNVSQKKYGGKDLVFILCVKDQAQCDILAQYIEQLPKKAYIYLAHIGIEISDKLKSAIKNIPFKHLHTQHFVNKKTTLIKIINDAPHEVVDRKYLCALYNKTNSPLAITISDEDMFRHSCECLIKNKKYISNVIDIFENNPRAGLLVPSPANFSNFYAQEYAKLSYSSSRADAIKKLYDSLKLTVPFDLDVWTNNDSIFYLRVSAIDNLKNISDVMLSDESLYSYLYPMIVQQSGFYTAWINNTSNASVYMDNQYYMLNKFNKKISQKNNRYVFSFRGVESLLNGLVQNTIQKSTAAMDLFALSYKEFIKFNLKYLRNKVSIFLKQKGIVRANSYLNHCSQQGQNALFFFLSNNKNIRLFVNNTPFSPKQELTDSQKYLYDFSKSAIAYEVPWNLLKNSKLTLKDANNKRVNIQWGNVKYSYNVNDFKKENMYFRVINGNILVEKKCRQFFNVLFSMKYTILDKFLLLFLTLNPFKLYSLYAENGGAADNAFQLFKYALSQKKRAYFIAKKEIKDSYQDKELKSRIIVKNSIKHFWIFMLSYKWITSFTLRLDIFPSSKKLKDIHFNLLQGKWYSIPHGVTAGDKTAIIVHKYLCDNPEKKFTASQYEQEVYTNFFEYKNVFALGSPRMDKWVNASLNDKEITIFFTWRYYFRDMKIDEFENSTYFKTVIQLLEHIEKKHPNYIINYVFHHELVNNKLDEVIKNAFSGKNIRYVYLNNVENIDTFNKVFKSSKYLITDYSSCAYDFAYKDNGISIYYLLPEFIEGHYPIEKKFYDIQLGFIANSLETLEQGLALKKPTKIMLERRKEFFKYLDGNNCKRVYDAIYNPKQQEKEKTRLGIYFFYDKDGIADDYVPYYLKHLKEHCNELCVVVNGKLDEASLKKLKQYADTFILRENIGFDSGAYKEAIEHYGYDKIKEYDNLLLCNFTVFGPIYPFSEMFDAMEQADVDFWGNNKHGGHDGIFAGTRVLAHVQSHFINFKKNIINSDDFKNYWNSMNKVNNYEEAIAFHELRCTKYFSDLGYKYTGYQSPSKYEKIVPKNNASIVAADLQIKEDRSPLLKRKVFYFTENDFCWPTRKTHQLDLLKYIKKETDYPVSLIKQNISRENSEILKTIYKKTKLEILLRLKIVVYGVLSKFFFGGRKYFLNKLNRALEAKQYYNISNLRMKIKILKCFGKK